MSNSIQDFGGNLQYRFLDETLLATALTHSSWPACRKGKKQNNERLEFLGDAFFDAIIGEELYKRLPEEEEGVLTKLRAKVVCERTLAVRGKALGVGEAIQMGYGEEKNGGRGRDSIIADAMEAIIGAVFLDGGYEAARAFVLSLFGQALDDALSGKLQTDYKSALQEKVQEAGAAHKKLDYRVTGEDGPDHNKTFYVDLLLDDRLIGRGSGRSKKEAEKNAAQAALEESDGFVF